MPAVNKQATESDQETFWTKVRAVAKRAGRAYLATVDAGRPRVRVVFPAFEKCDVWIATKRNSARARQIERDPNIELFWEAGNSRPISHLTIAGVAHFVDDLSEKKRVWSAKLFGYDLAEFWPGGPESRGFGLLLVTAERVELGTQPGLWQGELPEVWRSPVSRRREFDLGSSTQPWDHMDSVLPKYPKRIGE